MASKCDIAEGDLGRLGVMAQQVARALACSIPEAIDWIEHHLSGSVRTERNDLGSYAARLLRLRALRDELLGPQEFHDLAWVMMLDLFIQERRGQRVSVSSLTIASGGSTTTALRQISRLITQGMIARSDDVTDGRRSWLTLTDHARDMLTAVLRRMQLEHGRVAPVSGPTADPA